MSVKKYLDYEGLTELVNQLRPEDNFSETSKKAVENQLITNTINDLLDKLIELFEEYMDSDIIGGGGGGSAKITVISKELKSTTPTATVTFETAMKNTDYMVHIEAEVENINDEVGEIYITDKTTTGFKVTYTGSANAVNVKMYIQGGMTDA